MQHSCTETHEKLALMLNFWGFPNFSFTKIGEDGMIIIKSSADIIFEKHPPSGLRFGLSCLNQSLGVVSTTGESGCGAHFSPRLRC